MTARNSTYWVICPRDGWFLKDGPRMDFHGRGSGTQFGPPISLNLAGCPSHGLGTRERGRIRQGAERDRMEGQPRPEPSTPP